MSHRKTNRRAEEWIGSIVSHRARGEVDYEKFGERLHNIIDQRTAGINIQGVVATTLPQINSDVKRDKIPFQCATDRITHHMLTAKAWNDLSPMDSGCESPDTIGSMVRGWAEVMGQDSGEFEKRTYPALQSLVEEWQLKTGALGFTEKEVFDHPREAGDFVAAFVNLLLKETPRAILANIVTSIISEVTDTPSGALEAGLREPMKKVCQFEASRTISDLGALFQAKPEVKQTLAAPEVTAIVEWIEHNNGWGGNPDLAVELLTRSIGPRLLECENDGRVKIALKNALKSVGRGNLLHIIDDAIRGKLSGKLLDSALRWVKGNPKVEVHWGFAPLSEGEDHTDGIRRWLFRGR